MTVVNGVFLDELSRSPLIQVEQHLEEVVQVGLLARLLYPDVQQIVDPVFVGKVFLPFDHVVGDAEVTEESLVIVNVDFFEVVEAFPQRPFACGQRQRRSFVNADESERGRRTCSDLG